MSDGARRRSLEDDVQMNMTPMIDVTFQLLIFFIITLKFKTLESKLHSYLPEDMGLNRTPRPIPELSFELKLRQSRSGSRELLQRDTELFIAGESMGVASSPAALASVLERVDRFQKVLDSEGKIKLDVGRAVPHHVVVSVMSALIEGGHRKLIFTGMKPKTVAQLEKELRQSSR